MNDPTITNIKHVNCNFGISKRTQVHIFHGEPKNNSRITGYHHELESNDDPKVIGKVKKVIKTKFYDINVQENKRQIYEAMVVNKNKMNGKTKKSTFFPKGLSRSHVLETIDYIKNNCCKIDDTYICLESEFLSSDGLTILPLYTSRIVLDYDGEVVTAFPELR